MQWWRAALAALLLASACGAGSGGAPPPPPPALAELLQRAGAGVRRVGTAPGRSSRRPLVPEPMRALYAQLSAADPLLPEAFTTPKSPLHQRVANTVRSFTHEVSDIDKRFKDAQKFRLLFNVSIPDDETLRVAELVLARDSIKNLPDGDPSEHRHKVLVYDIVKPGVKGQSVPELRLVDSKWVRLTQGGSVRLDVTRAAERWLWLPQENHGLLVTVASAPHLRRHQHVRLRRAAGEPRGVWRTRQPALLAFTDDGRAPIEPPPSPALRPARERRSPSKRPHRRKDHRETCQRRSLYVDFHDVGWSDWIVAPNGYDAYYCHGDCPFPLPDHFNSTNHAIVQTLVNSVNPAAVPKACCVPTTLSSASLLYLDEENKVMLKNYLDMVVVGCGCR